MFFKKLIAKRYIYSYIVYMPHVFFSTRMRKELLRKYSVKIVNCFKKQKYSEG